MKEYPRLQAAQQPAFGSRPAPSASNGWTTAVQPGILTMKEAIALAEEYEKKMTEEEIKEMIERGVRAFGSKRVERIPGTPHEEAESDSMNLRENSDTKSTEN